MVYSSLIFLLFLFVCLLIQHFCPDTRSKNIVLLIFSLIFYLWGGIISLLLLLAVTVVDWYAALQIDAEPHRAKRKRWLTIAVAINVALFVLLRVWHLFPWALDETVVTRYAIPMGFAFYTIQLISYLVDVYKKAIPAEKSFPTLLLYSSLFSQSAGGPVIRYADISEELQYRRVKSSTMSKGIMRFSCGLAKKVLLADSCGVVVTTLIGEDAASVAAAPVLSVWIAGIFFMLQIFLELSGFADMAIGLGLMCGFHFPENFDYPYMATSLKEFWSKWNITVVSFFRNYVYRPLGSRRYGTAVQILNLVITALLFGLWCGGSANFMIWALYCLVLILIESLFRDRMNDIVGHVWVLLTMFVGFLMFRSTDMAMLGATLKGLIGLNGSGFATVQTFAVLGRHILLLILSIAACTPITRLAGAYMKEKSTEDRRWMNANALINAICPAVLLVLSIAGMVGNQVPGFLFFQL